MKTFEQYLKESTTEKHPLPVGTKLMPKDPHKRAEYEKQGFYYVIVKNMKNGMNDYFLLNANNERLRMGTGGSRGGGTTETLLDRMVISGHIPNFNPKDCK